jgi:hypothetical protein
MGWFFAAVALLETAIVRCDCGYGVFAINMLFNQVLII